MVPRSHRSLLRSMLLTGLIAGVMQTIGFSQALPDAAAVQPVQVLTVPSYCEGVVFDQEGVAISLGVSRSRSLLWTENIRCGQRLVRRTDTRSFPTGRILFAMPANMRCCICQRWQDVASRIYGV